MSDRNDEIRTGIALARAGDWEAAHAVAQRHEGDPYADWLHAVLHKIEGDQGNARYWYRRCGRSADAYSDPQAELAALSASLSLRYRSRQALTT
ncbi:MAG: hypothetical protein AAF732_02815 [Pseudomonadota bacterium]